MEDQEQYEALSLRTRRKKPSSAVGLSCCFNGHHHHHHHRADSLDTSSSPVMNSPTSRLMPPSSLKGRYKSLISRVSRHRRHSSADFTYDPLSYSRNFEDDGDVDPSDPDDFPIRSFASRLPLSPPRSGRTTFTASPSSSSSSSSSTSSATRKTVMGPPPIQQQITPCASRAAAVAEVRNNLEEAKPREARPDQWKLEEVRTSPNIPTTIPCRKVKTARAVLPERERERERRRSIDLLTPATEVRRGGYEYEDEHEEISPALVGSPTSRQVLVELC